MAVRKFSDSSATMDRTALVAALQAIGMDTAGITDAVPDEVLRAFVDAAQKLQTQTPLPADVAAVQKETDKVNARFQAFSERARMSQAKSGTLSISPERRAAMLNASPAGRALLAKERRK